MNEFKIDIQLRWSDLDPNFHLRHSVYYDWGAMCRIEFFEKYDLTTKKMQTLHIGPIIFREECVFKSEILSGDKVTIDMVLLKARRDFSRWSIQHKVMKNGDILSAIITIDGAWIDTAIRKLAHPDKEIAAVCSAMQMDEGFTWTD